MVHAQGDNWRNPGDFSLALSLSLSRSLSLSLAWRPWGGARAVLAVFVSWMSTWLESGDVGRLWRRWWRRWFSAATTATTITTTTTTTITAFPITADALTPPILVVDVVLVVVFTEIR